MLTAPGRWERCLNMGIRILSAVLAGVLLTGCQSSIITEITPVEGGADVRVVLEFEGDIVGVLLDDEPSREAFEAQLESLVEVIEVVEPGKRYILRPTAAEVLASSAITGIGAIRVRQTEIGTEIQVDTVEPYQLRQAIRSTTAGAEDSEALEKTMITNTFLEVRIISPGAVAEHNGGIVEGRTVSYRESIDMWSSGTLMVQSGGAERDWLLWAGVVVVLVGATWYVRRRK